MPDLYVYSSSDPVIIRIVNILYTLNPGLDTDISFPAKYVLFSFPKKRDILDKAASNLIFQQNADFADAHVHSSHSIIE